MFKFPPRNFQRLQSVISNIQRKCTQLNLDGREAGPVGMRQEFGSTETVHKGLVNIQLKISYFFFYPFDGRHAFTGC